MTVEENKALVRRGWEIAGTLRSQAMKEVYDRDVLYHGTAGEEIRGLESVVAFIQGYFTAFPDMKFTVEDVFGEGDRVFSRVRVEGTNTGEMMGTPPTGKRLDIRWLMNVARIADGKIVEEWEIFDQMDMMRQLGLAQ